MHKICCSAGFVQRKEDPVADVVLTLTDTSEFTVDVAGPWPGPVQKFGQRFADFYRILKMYTYDGFAYPFNDGDVDAFLVSGTPVTIHNVDDPDGFVRKLTSVFGSSLAVEVVTPV